MKINVVGKCPNCDANNFMVIGTTTYTGYVDENGELHLTTDSTPAIENDVDCIGCGESFPITSFLKVSIE
jgi:hypothetical protein